MQPSNKNPLEDKSTLTLLLNWQRMSLILLVPVLVPPVADNVAVVVKTKPCSSEPSGLPPAAELLMVTPFTIACSGKFLSGAQPGPITVIFLSLMVNAG